MGPWLLPLITGVGSLFGSAASAKSDAKQQQSNMATQQGQNELAAYTAAMAGKARQAEDIATRPTDRLQQGALGNLVSGWSPTNVEWGGAGTIPKISGGFNDLQFNPMTRQSAELMQRDALLRQMQGQRAPDITQVGQVPDVTKNYPKSGGSWLDTILGIGGMAGGIADIWQNAKTGTKPRNTLGDPNNPWS